MMLYPLDLESRIATNIARISTRLRIEVMALEVERIEGVVIIANGTPDDIAFSIISHHSDGEITVGIAKPRERTGIGVIDVLPSYAKAGRIMVLMDQEDRNIQDIFSEARKKLINAGFRVIKEVEEEMLKIYHCQFAGRSVVVVLVVNGLDEIQTEKHTVEDHLLRASEVFGIEIGNFENSKDAWRRMRNYHEEIFVKLKKSREIEEIFPQQFRGCEYLKRIS
ncbi:MAG TPA: hypothetical protein EYP68_04405 [Candidatus Korarchaeota archaeon]|nr:hypothetical protein [Candidatus Korarchaeota archaeon]